MRILRFAAAFILLASVSSADLVITQKVEGGGQTGDVVIKIKGDKIRADMPREVSSIMDAATGEVLTLMHTQKSLLRITPERAKEMLKKMSEQVAGAATSTATLTPANRQEKVGEWDTDVFTATVGNVDVTYWVAKNFPNYERIAESLEKMQMGTMAGLNSVLGPRPREFPGMPVKTEMTLGGKKITNTVVSVKEEPVDDAIFQAPKGYKEIELPEQPAAK